MCKECNTISCMCTLHSAVISLRARVCVLCKLTFRCYLPSDVWIFQSMPAVATVVVLTFEKQFEAHLFHRFRPFVVTLSSRGSFVNVSCGFQLTARWTGHRCTTYCATAPPARRTRLVFVPTNVEDGTQPISRRQQGRYNVADIAARLQHSVTRPYVPS